MIHIDTIHSILNRFHIDTLFALLTKKRTSHMYRRLGDYGPSSREVIDAIGHPTPVPPALDDGPLTERCPRYNPELHEVDVSQHVSLYMEPLTPGAIYLVKRPSNKVNEPMYLRTYQDDIAMFQDMFGERLTMGTNLARESIQKRYTTRDMLEALARGECQ